MKIALIVPGFSADERDWCIPALRDYAQALSRRAEVHVLALRWPEHAGSYSCFGASVRALGGRPHMGARALGLWNRADRALSAEHRRAPFDVLHAFWADEPGWLAAWIGRKLGVPVVISIAGGEIVALREIGYGGLRIPGRGAMTRWGLGRAAAVGVGSRYLLDLAREHLGVRDRTKLIVAPLGVDTTLFSRPARALRPPLVHLNVGSLYPVKGQAILIRAFARAVAPPAVLRIVGAGPLRADLEKLASDLGVAERVAFLGEIPHERMPEVYRNADLFVQSSLHEAQGMAVLEAAACGLPAVGTAVGLLPEIGRASPPGDEFALAGVLGQGPRAEDAPLRDRLVAECSLSAVLGRFLDLYRSIARPRS
jgi:glycosyltransferase involved in cell wall biosynthesis